MMKVILRHIPCVYKMYTVILIRIKKRVACCIGNSAQLVVEFVSSKAPSQYLLKRSLIALPQLVIFEKIQRTICATNCKLRRTFRLQRNKIF